MYGPCVALSSNLHASSQGADAQTFIEAGGRRCWAAARSADARSLSHRWRHQAEALVICFAKLRGQFVMSSRNFCVAMRTDSGLLEGVSVPGPTNWTIGIGCCSSYIRRVAFQSEFQHPASTDPLMKSLRSFLQCLALLALVDPLLAKPAKLPNPASVVGQRKNSLLKSRHPRSTSIRRKC